MINVPLQANFLQPTGKPNFSLVEGANVSMSIAARSFRDRSPYVVIT